jgi:hypothetical protein
MATRKQILESIKVAGYHNDDKAFIRLYTENHISYAKAQEARTLGIRARQNGVKCSCYACNNRPTY